MSSRPEFFVSTAQLFLSDHGAALNISFAPSARSPVGIEWEIALIGSVTTVDLNTLTYETVAL